MPLINYVEPINIGNIFIGVGGLILTLVLAYFMYRIFKTLSDWMTGIYNHDLKYWVFEEKMLDEVAKEKGIDLDAELLKRNVLEKPRKSFRKRVEDEVFERTFGKEETSKVKK